MKANITTCDTICIDAGVGGGIAFNIDEKVFFMNMPTVPPKCKSKEFSDIQVKKIAEIVCFLPNHAPIWLEQVGPRPCDTPKTSWRFSANYHCIMCAITNKVGSLFSWHLQLPSHWQAQLPVVLPSGQHFYEVRKKLLKDFATEKFPEVTRLSQNKKGDWKENKAKPTSKTADALCMLWVNAGFE